MINQSVLTQRLCKKINNFLTAGAVLKKHFPIIFLSRKCFFNTTPAIKNLLFF